MIIYILLTALALTLAWELYKKIIKKKKESENAVVIEEKPVFLSDEEVSHENAVRKKWISSFYGNASITCISFFVTYLGALPLQEMAKPESIAAILLGIVISLVAITPWCWITYHCAYKKKGTKWLLWNMISLPLAELIGFSSQPKHEWGIFIILFVTAALTIEAYYWVNCYQLCKINLELKNEKNILSALKNGEFDKQAP